MDRSKSGISPVMATVILVAIAIVIAIAVAFWATGLVGVFTRFEKIEIVAAYAKGSNEVVLVVKNTGSASATIDDIYVNGIPCGGPGHCGFAQTISLTPGQSATININEPPSDVGSSFISGVTYEVAVHTASGKMYPAAVLIP
ncbi:MAG: hypothetical protein J7K49_03375 [Thaumarchaeota archaeon]|nr:hypothetical protein [Nitrososphaerota archaeon]